ncbi:ABC-type uncharacterized transport system [Geobacter sp. OR-1]|uniref:GldG family protein n=1 Tax=Geobacter sp. OR-1 TaxID=1266765 RepID=UPI0005432699|nr:DUF4350 domain-containing protein [Geobacter sp. OR-1]GAM10208.1 ABC-type uncharacterized transport system [Geobacter sp. OR-1]
MNKITSITGVAGVLLGIGALAYSSIYPADTVIITVIALLALALLGWFVVAEFAHFRILARKQATYLRLNNFLMLVFAIFAVVLINLIVRQYYYRADLSTTRRYTLALQSMTVAKGIDRETEILFFGTEGGKEHKRVRELMDMYRYLNRKIIYTFYDLDRSPLKAKEYNVVDYNTLVFRSGEKVVTARGADEEAITNLLIRGTKRKVINVRYLQGHNEHSLSETDRDGYGRVLAQLSAQGFNLQPLDLRGAELSPTQVDLLIIASPKTELSPEEHEKLWNYREKGGKLLVLVDGPGPMTPFLKTFAIQVGDEPVYDTQNVAGTDPSTPLVNSYPDTPITRSFRLSTVFPGAHGLYYKANIMLGFNFDSLVQTSPNNWLEANGNRVKDPGEEAHPQVLAAIVSHPDKLVKMVLFGDSDFASNAYFGVAGNANLFVNAVNWLCGEGAMVSVAPAKVEFVPMFVSEQQSRLLRVLVPVGIPLLFVAAGTLVWWRRRRL